jgi:hypothetical protein
VIDFIGFLSAQFSVILLKAPIHAASQATEASLSTKLSTVGVDG